MLAGMSAGSGDLDGDAIDHIWVVSWGHRVPLVVSQTQSCAGSTVFFT